MLVTLGEILRDAQQRRYGVGMFNATNLEMTKGVLSAAEQTASPVIIGTAEVLLNAASLEELAYFMIPMARKARVPVAVHFDHGLTEAHIEQAMACGFTSIMYDCSTAPYEENLRRVSAMAKRAHALGVSIEGELGHVGANAHAVEGGEGDVSIYTDPAQAADYAARTGVDALAIAIGNAHGVYLETPKLNHDVLARIRAGVSCPLVLHGGSGLSDEDFRDCIGGGVCKVNIFTDINLAAARAVADGFHPGAGYTDLEPLMVEAVNAEVRKKMQLFGSVGKA